jgi:hypothetical protein
MNASPACNNHENRTTAADMDHCTGECEGLTLNALHTSHAILDTALRQVRILLQPLAANVHGAEREQLAVIQRVVSRALAGEAPMTGGQISFAPDTGENYQSTADALNGLLRRYGSR